MGTPYVPKTQKARGVAALRTTGYAVPAAIVKSARSVRLKPAETLEKARAKLGMRVFGRSCPPVPNHGGVPSRKVSTHEELLALAEENLAYHKGSEIMLMAPIDAMASAIWTPGLLTIGEGHDGATAAKEAIVLPVPSSPSCDPFNAASAAAGITSWPYLEIVYARAISHLVPSETWFVQLRDGPKLPGPMADFIPTTMVVEKVLTVSENDIRDELAWARDLPLLTPGTAIYCPGAGLTSHYAVQCIALWKDAQGKAIPFVTSREPIVGETLAPPPLTIPQGEAQAATRRGYLSAWELEVKPKDAIVMGLLGLHAASALTANYHGSFFHGLAAGLLVRGTNLICRGELRYKTKGYAFHSGWENRNKVYTAYWPLKKVHLAAAQRVFANASFWNSKLIGGHKWHRIANHAVATHNAIIKGEPFLESYNKLANAVHNCGWAFNKLVKSAELGALTTDPALAMVNNGAAIWSAMTAAMKIVSPKERRPLKLYSITEEDYQAQIVVVKAKTSKTGIPMCPSGKHCGCSLCKGTCYCTAPVCSDAGWCASHTKDHKGNPSHPSSGAHPGPGLPLNGCTNCFCSCHVMAVAPPEPEPVVHETPYGVDGDGGCNECGDEPSTVSTCGCKCHPASHCDACNSFTFTFGNPGHHCDCDCHTDEDYENGYHPFKHHHPAPAVPATPKAPVVVGPTVTQCKLANGFVHVQQGNIQHYSKWDVPATDEAQAAWDAAPKVESLAEKGTTHTPYALCTISEDHSAVMIGVYVIGKKATPGPPEKPAPKAEAKPLFCKNEECASHQSDCLEDHANATGACVCACKCHPNNNNDGKPSCHCGCCDDSIPLC